MMVEVFVPSYFGSLTQIKSKRLSYDVFSSNWLHENQKYKMNLMILVERTLRPMHLKCGNLVELGLETFLKVCSEIL